MLRAVWNGVVLAEAPRTVRVEGNHYFPPGSVNREYVEESSTRTVCPWKGVARYYTVRVGDQVAPDLAWYYPKPFPLARKITDHVAFYGQVTVEGAPEPESGPESADTGSAGASGGPLGKLLGFLRR